MLVHLLQLLEQLLLLALQLHPDIVDLVIELFVLLVQLHLDGEYLLFQFGVFALQLVYLLLLLFQDQLLGLCKILQVSGEFLGALCLPIQLRHELLHLNLR